MRNFIILLFLCFSTSYSFAQTQLELNTEAKSNFQKADKELNVTYSKILKEYNSDTVFIKNFKAAQNIWIKFRDAEMKMKYPEREAGYYGSIQTVCWYNYLEELTKKRTKELKTWLTGIEEGNSCSGSVKIK